MRRVTAIIIATSLAALTACSSSRGVIASGHELDIEPCATAEGAVIDVDDLETITPVACALTAIRLRFPDGTLIDVDEHAGTGSSQPGDGREYGFGKFDIYGVAVYSDIPGAERTWWGTPEGIRRLQYLEGLVDSY